MPLAKRKRVSTAKRSVSKSSFSSRFKRAKRSGRTGYANIVRIGRQVSSLRKMIETKEITHGISSTNIAHNNITVFMDRDSALQFNPFRLSQGAADTDSHQNVGGNRIGDSISVKGMKIKMFLENSLGRAKVYFRLMLLRGPRGVVPSRANLFKGRSDNKMLDGLDTKQWTIMWQKECNVSTVNSAPLTVGLSGVPTTGTPAGNATRIVTAWIPGRRFGRSGVIQYEQGSTSNVKFFDYTLVALAYDWYGTPQDVNNVGLLNEAYSTIYFKDA